MAAIRREGSTVRFGPAFIDPTDLETSVGGLANALNHEDVTVLIIDGLESETFSAADLVRFVEWATEEGRNAGVRVEYRL
jgi:hypothetical protein